MKPPDFAQDLTDLLVLLKKEPDFAQDLKSLPEGDALFDEVRRELDGKDINARLRLRVATVTLDVLPPGQTQ